MKKQSLLLITGGILAFASCNTDTSGNAEEMQAKVDSIVNARVEQIRMDLEAKNNEYIMEMAIARADSIMAAMSGKKVVVKKPVKHTSVGEESVPVSDNGNSAKPMDKPKDGLKAHSDDNKQSGSQTLKSKSDANQQSGSSKLKSKSDK